MLTVLAQVQQCTVHLLLVAHLGQGLSQALALKGTGMRKLSSTAKALCSLLLTRAMLNKLRRSSAQHCSTASRQGSGRSSRRTVSSAVSSW